MGCQRAVSVPSSFCGMMTPSLPSGFMPSAAARVTRLWRLRRSHWRRVGLHFTAMIAVLTNCSFEMVEGSSAAILSWRVLAGHQLGFEDLVGHEGGLCLLCHSRLLNELGL